MDPGVRTLDTRNMDGRLHTRTVAVGESLVTARKSHCEFDEKDESPTRDVVEESTESTGEKVLGESLAGTETLGEVVVEFKVEKIFGKGKKASALTSATTSVSVAVVGIPPSAKH